MLRNDLFSVLRLICCPFFSETEEKIPELDEKEPKEDSPEKGEERSEESLKGSEVVSEVAAEVVSKIVPDPSNIAAEQEDHFDFEKHLAKQPKLKPEQIYRITTLDEEIQDNARRLDINVVGVSGDYPPDKMKELIVKRNIGIRELYNDDKATDEEKHISVRSIKPFKSYKGKPPIPYKVTLRVSKLIREILQGQGNKLTFGQQNYRVYNCVKIPRCAQCQEFDMLENCNCKKEVCCYCAGNHTGENCSERFEKDFKPTCANCKSGGMSEEEIGHTAFSLDCPSLIAKEREIEDQIPYYLQRH